jgi:hypothetical protein
LSEPISDKLFQLQIFTPEKADAYLSCVWRSGRKRDVSWRLLRELDQAGIRVIGDVPDLNHQDDNRIRRIMKDCSGFLTILPYCDAERSTTSPHLIRELRVAAELGLPVAIVKESRVALEIVLSATGQVLKFGNDLTVPPVHIEPAEVLGPVVYDDEDDRLEPALHPTMDDFIATVLQGTVPTRAYAFMITRLEKDFAQAREAISTAVEDEAGMPCLWSDEGLHRTNIESVRERTRLMIKHAALVIADLTLGTENPDHENPSRAHEIGMAVAYRRPIMLCSQEPRRVPYFSIGDMQTVFWETEADLELSVREWIRAHRDMLGREVYNRKLVDVDPGYKLKVENKTFAFNPTRRYIGPKTYAWSTEASWIVAGSFGIMAFSLTHLANTYLEFDHTFDVAACLAAGFTVVFASNLNRKIQELLGRWAYLRWGLLLVAFTLLVLVL